MGHKEFSRETLSQPFHEPISTNNIWNKGPESYSDEVWDVYEYEYEAQAKTPLMVKPTVVESSPRQVDSVIDRYLIRIAMVAAIVTMVAMGIGPIVMAPLPTVPNLPQPLIDSPQQIYFDQTPVPSAAQPTQVVKAQRPIHVSVHQVVTPQLRDQIGRIVAAADSIIVEQKDWKKATAP